MKIGIYAPWLKTAGGGEKYIGKMAEVLSEGHRVEFICFETPDLGRLEKRLSLDLSRVGIRLLNVSKFAASRRTLRSYRLQKATADYDLFINQEDHSILRPRARVNAFVWQVPPIKNKIGIISCLKKGLFSFLFDLRFEHTQKIITYSEFSKRVIQKFHPEKNIEVIYPPIDTEYFKASEKKNVILHVGRYFKGGHSKKQLELIRLFKLFRSRNKELSAWELHLTGAADTVQENLNYVEACKKEASGEPIYLHVNAPFNELKELYCTSKIFWFATGLGEDEELRPDRMEHFGITTGEAMSAGCVPVAINRGGQPEIVAHEEDGFLWDEPEELEEYTLRLVRDPVLLDSMSIRAARNVQRFNAARFKREVLGSLERS